MIFVLFIIICSCQSQLIVRIDNNEYTYCKNWASDSTCKISNITLNYKNSLIIYQKKNQKKDSQKLQLEKIKIKGRNKNSEIKITINNFEIKSSEISADRIFVKSQFVEINNVLIKFKELLIYKCAQLVIFNSQLISEKNLVVKNFANLYPNVF